MPQYKLPKARQPKEELVLDDRMQAISDEYKALGYQYTPSQEEKEQLIFEKYKKKFNSTYGYYVQYIFRIKHHDKEYLVYRIIEEVLDNNGQAHTCERVVGHHSSPISRARHNEFGEVIDAEITGHRLVYEIPFDRDFLAKLIDGSRTHPSDLCVGHGTDYPPDVIAGNPQKVWNEQEFIEYDFDDLLGASIAGYCRTGYGGVAEYAQAQKTRLAATNDAVKEQQAQLHRKVEQQQRK